MINNEIKSYLWWLFFFINIKNVTILNMYLKIIIGEIERRIVCTKLQ